MRTIIKLTLVLAVSASMFAGCYPKGREYYSDSDLTITDYDMEYDFGSQKNYFMADTVQYLTNKIEDKLKPAEIFKLLEEIESNLAAAGYSRLSEAAAYDAEFVIGVTVMSTKNTGTGYIPGPPYYPGWGWGSGWGGYYPPYWGSYYTYNYTTGSVIIQWWDPQSAPVEADKQPIHWIAAFNGLVSDSNPDDNQRIANGIQQAFKQSPYIQSDN